VLLALASTAFGQAAQAPPPDGISVVLRAIERALEADDSAAYVALLSSPSADDKDVSAFLDDWIVPGITRAVVHERMRVPSADVPEGAGYDLYVDVLAETGRAGRVSTWLMELRKGPSDQWRIKSLTVLTTVRGLYRLILNPEKEFTVTNLVLTAEDFEVRLPTGLAFVAEVPDGTTAMVLLGSGEFTFSPAPRAEKGQVKIFSGSETMKRRFDWLYVRASAGEFDDHISPASLQPRPVDRRDYRHADVVFQDNVSRAYGLDLGDLSRDKWSVTPKSGDLVTEIQTEGSHLTYMRSTGDPEDIRFFDRTHQRTIAIYSSRETLASHGPFFTEDDRTDYDILNYDVDASFDPTREWIEGKVRVMLVAKRPGISTFIFSLAEPLVIRSVVSRRYGYLMALRVSGQDDVIINLPDALETNVVLDLEFVYGGRLHAPPPEREALELPQQQTENDFYAITQEPSYIYTGRSYWYPEGNVTDYATANLVLRVPDRYSSVATGAVDEGFPKMVTSQSRTWKEYHYSATQPVRYLGWAISRFVHVDSGTVTLPPQDETAEKPVGVSYSEADVDVESSSMLRRRALELSEVTQDAMKFFGGLVDDFPYQSFTLAVVERSTPGGHSPPYFAALSQPPPATPIAWRSDPAFFADFPEFFVAHETAHQWWGHAVGWKNYHEQWISEGFAQYFAALYAEHVHEKEVFDKVISQMSRWTVNRSDQGPVYLGYRLGHIKNDSRVFRALVYNKGAIVLHMLRRLIGDDAFFTGLRRFYTTWRFKKAGTEDVKAAFEAESGQSLDRFFERWIYNDSLPRLKFTYKIEPDAVVVRFEQTGEIFDVPVTVSIEYGTATPDTEVVVPVTDRVTEKRIPLTGLVKDVEANRDNASAVIFVK